MVAIEVDCWPLNQSLPQLRLAMQDYTHTETTYFLVDPDVYGSLPITRWTLEVADFFGAQAQFASADAVKLRGSKK
jgi:hypothetical protein